MPIFNQENPPIILAKLLHFTLVIILIGYIGLIEAATVRINFSGAVSIADGNPGIETGTLIDGYIDYNTNVLDENSSPSIGDYKQPITAINIFLNGQEIVISNVIFDDNNNIYIEKRADYDYLLIQTNFYTDTLINTWSPLRLQMVLTDSQRTAITDDSLPLSFTLDEFDRLGNILDPWDGHSGCLVCAGQGFFGFYHRNTTGEVPSPYPTPSSPSSGVVVTYDYVVAELFQDDDPTQPKDNFPTQPNKSSSGG